MKFENWISTSSLVYLHLFWFKLLFLLKLNSPCRAHYTAVYKNQFRIWILPKKAKLTNYSFPDDIPRFVLSYSNNQVNVCPSLNPVPSLKPSNRIWRIIAVVFLYCMYYILLTCIKKSFTNITIACSKNHEYCARAYLMS